MELHLCDDPGDGGLYEHSAGWVTALGVETGRVSEICGTAAVYVQVHNQFFMVVEWARHGHRTVSVASCGGPSPFCVTVSSAADRLRPSQDHGQPMSESGGSQCTNLKLRVGDPGRLRSDGLHVRAQVQGEVPFLAYWSGVHDPGAQGGLAVEKVRVHRAKLRAGPGHTGTGLPRWH